MSEFKLYTIWDNIVKKCKYDSLSPPTNQVEYNTFYLALRARCRHCIRWKWVSLIRNHSCLLQLVQLHPSWGCDWVTMMWGHKVISAMALQGKCRWNVIPSVLFNGVNSMSFWLSTGQYLWRAQVSTRLETFVNWVKGNIHPCCCRCCCCFFKHDTCHPVTFIVMVNSHQRWKQTRNRVCFHLWYELT